MKKFVSWNVNGLRAIMKKDFMESFHKLDADAIGLQETKLQEGQISMDLPGYYQYWNYAMRKGYSGTALFVKEKPIKVTYGIEIEEHDQEGRVITAEYPDYYLITVYVPNSGESLARLDYRMTWEDAFLNYINQLREVKPVVFCGDLNKSPSCDISNPKIKPIIICGDLNVALSAMDLKNPSSNHHNAGFTDEERNKFRNLLNSGYTDTFRYLYPDKVKYSWWSYRFNARANNAGWRIDYFLTSDFAKDKIIDAKIHTDIYGSDHCPVELDVKL